MIVERGGREWGGTMRRGMGTTVEYRRISKPAAIAHNLAQITTCIYTQMNHICTKSTRQTNCIDIDGKQTLRGEWTVLE